MSTRAPKLSLAKNSAAFSSLTCEEGLHVTNSADCSQQNVSPLPGNYSVSERNKTLAPGLTFPGAKWTGSQAELTPSFANRSNSFSERRNPTFFSKARATSLDVEDEYFLAKFPARRRSSCKEVVLQFLKNDTAGSGESGQPQFVVTEEERPLSVAGKKSLFTTEDHKRPLPNSFDSSTENIYEAETGSDHVELQRSISADDSNSISHKDRLLLHKSMPDLYAHDKLKMESLKEAWGPKLGGKGAVRHLKKLRSAKLATNNQDPYGPSFWKQMF